MLNLPAPFAHITRHYLGVVTVALVFGLLVPGAVAWLAPYASVLLAAIFFLTALKLNPHELAGDLWNVRLMLEVNVAMLVVLPVVVFFATRALAPELALPFLLLAAMPTAMAAPLITEIVGGRPSLALACTVSTSLLAPFTVPLLVRLLAGAEVTVDFLAMFRSLALVIVLPFALAGFVRQLRPQASAWAQVAASPLSTTMLALLVAGVVGRQSGAIWQSLGGGQNSYVLVALFVLFACLHLLGYLAVPWRPTQDRLTVSICLTYMNFTLALYLVERFFPEPRVAVPVVLSVLPWVVLVAPLHYLAVRFHLTRSAA